VILNNRMLYLSAVVLVLSWTRLAGFVSRGSLLGSSTIRACTKTVPVNSFPSCLFPCQLFPLHFLIHSLQCCGPVTFWYGSGRSPVPLTYGSGSRFGACFFVSGLRCQQKLSFFFKVSLLFLFEGTFTSDSQIKSPRGPKT
jgi:hypothetical protein